MDSDSDSNFDPDPIPDETPGGEPVIIKVFEQDSMESTYDTTLSCTVGELISRYLEDKGFPKDFPIQFTFNGKVLDKNKTLEEQGIKDEDKLRATKEVPQQQPIPVAMIPPVGRLDPEPKKVAQEPPVKVEPPKPEPEKDDSLPQQIEQQAKPIYQRDDVVEIPAQEKPKQVIVNYYESDDDDDFNDNDDEKGDFYLRVKGTDGETVDIQCKPSDTLSTVKDKYYELKNISGSQNSVPYFSFQGKNLNLYKKINEIDGLNNGSLLNYYQRLKGGL